VDYVQNEQRVEPGEWFYTSGDDGVFPKGFPAGPVAATQPGNSFQQISVTPASLQRGLEEVLIILEGVHQVVPEGQVASPEIHVLPRPAPEPALGVPAAVEGQPRVTGTDADRLKEQYRALGAAQGHTFGAGAPGSQPPDFSRPAQPPQPPSPSAGQDPAASPPPKPAP
jgi:rod shape-determining protein MreC